MLVLSKGAQPISQLGSALSVIARAARGARRTALRKPPRKVEVMMPKILLVEDNEMNRDMLSRRLIRNGFEVVMAVDGQQGVEMAASERPDLILMDMSLPVMDGWEATRRIKADPATQRDSGDRADRARAWSQDREKAMAAGCDDFDTKPVELPRLLEKINALLGKAPQRSNAA